MRVHLDVLRARASALARGGAGARGGRGARVGRRALGTYADSIAALQQASSTEEVAKLAPNVAAGLGPCRRPAARLGEPCGLHATTPSRGSAAPIRRTARPG